MKKIASLIGAGAVLFSMALPTLAWGGTDITGNFTTIFTKTFTKAESGDNNISGKYVHGGKISTGTSVSESLVSNMVNSIETFGAGADIERNFTMIGTKNVTVATSGDNNISGKCVSGGRIFSGASGASSLVSNVVNSVLMPAMPSPVN